MSCACYVALGYPKHNGWSLESPPPEVVAVSDDEDVLTAWVLGLRDEDGHYQDEGRTYTSVEVVGPVPRIVQ